LVFVLLSWGVVVLRAVGVPDKVETAIGRSLMLGFTPPEELVGKVLGEILGEVLLLALLP
jgi:hypothetical protein